MKRLARVGGTLAGVVLPLLAGYVIWSYRFDILDWIVLRDYVPTAEVERLAAEVGMSDHGRRLYYVKDPQISSREEFVTQCANAEQTIVLGCYNGVSIYIFDVSDPRLYGVKQVTAAHEMLHVAYDRLDSDERSRVDTLTQAAFTRINDSRINELVKSYEKTEPGQVPNELHSILATEVRNLEPDLEQYYSRYFTDRSLVVTLSENYQKVFTDLKNQVEKLDADLSLRKSDIDRREKVLAGQAESISTQRAQMEAYLASGQNNAYNQLVPSFNAKVDTYNQGIAALQRLITEYNAIVEQRNNLGIEQSSLAESLDSRLKTIDQ